MTSATAITTRHPTTLYQRKEILVNIQQEMTANSPAMAAQKAAVPPTRLK